jgi:hypothetical protein
MNTVIALFSSTWQLVGTIVLQGTTLRLHTESGHDVPAVINQTIERIHHSGKAELNEPIKDEAGCVIGLVEVGPDDSRYLEAVEDEIRKAGVVAYRVDEALLEPLRWVSAGVGADVRGQVLPELLHLDVENASAALTAVAEKGKAG